MSSTPTDQLAYDVFEYSTKDTLRSLTPEILALTAVRPLNHFFGFHTFYPTLASGKGTAPFKTIADYDNNLKRHTQFVTLIDRSVGRFRQGLDSGVVETKMTIRNVIEQLDTQLKQKPEKSTYYGPIGVIPGELFGCRQGAAASAYRASITTELYPALTRLRDFLKTEYLPKARDGAGLMYMKGGDALYRQMIEQTTTLPLEPDAVHNSGPVRSRADHDRDGEGQDRGRLQGHARRNSSIICAPTPSSRSRPAKR